LHWDKFFSEYLGFLLSISFHQCFIPISIYVLILPEGKTGKAWEPSKKQYSFRNRGSVDREVFSIFFLISKETPSFPQAYYEFKGQTHHVFKGLILFMEDIVICCGNHIEI
jgi:hypothetical protein